MNTCSPTQATAAIVHHPQGGFTLAVPVGNGSTVRIYRGWWPRRPKKIPARKEAA